DEVNRMTHLGFPVYSLTVLGGWKILGVIAVLVPRFSLIKEWAYAGFFFNMTGAIMAHLALGDPISELFPSVLLLVLTVVSWHFRPADRKVVLVS
ncbi:MAG: DoxX family protein, partial [Bacteroidota bacterium]